MLQNRGQKLYAFSGNFSTAILQIKLLKRQTDMPKSFHQDIKYQADQLPGLENM
jgi:hypothetical protein